jgi:hypothetical protein
MWGPRFPVDVKQIALEYSRRFDDPVRQIAEADVPTFEGALMPLPKKGGWAILYNPSIKSAGRINYTLGHEWGHYLCHRHLKPAGFQCGPSDVLGTARNAALREQERQADQFASYLLMPLDDVRKQTDRQRMNFDLLRHCADRYDVSLTAAALKWLEYTTDCAAVVVAVNGFVSWCRRSDSARRARVFFPSGMELPAASVAASANRDAAAEGVSLPTGVWSHMPVREVSIFADAYEMTISLLVFEMPEYAALEHIQDEIEEDTFEHFERSTGSYAME